jgi:aryl-phospho-beta-D-glucosidase BglC (GH1 family)
MLSLMVALVATTAFAACGDDDDGGSPVGALKLTESSLSFTSEGGEATFSAQAAVQATATSDQAWCTVTVGTMTPNLKVTPVTVHVAPMTTGTDDRTATITVKAGAETASVTVTQKAPEEQPQDKPDDKPGQTITAKAMDIAKLMYPAWNLGNTMEPPGNTLAAETSWQSTKTSQQVIDYVKSLGFKAVRIPCSWNSHATNGQIDPAWMNRVKEVVDYCINDGLYVMLNDHWDNGWIEVDGFTNLSEANVSAKQQMLATLWTQIATAFRYYDEHLLFAALNEPNCDNQAKTNVLLRYEQAFIDAVRATGGNNAKRILIVQGPSTDIDNTDNYYDIARLNDTAENALMFEVHYYSPWNFCGMEKDESWGKMFYYWGAGNHVSGNQRNANWGEESYMQEQFRKMKRKFTDRGYPVILGEYGCQWRDLGSQSGENQAKHDASVKLFYRLVNEYGVNNGIVPVVWDINHPNREGTKGMMTIVNRNSLTIFGQPAMEGITEGAAAGKWPE